MKITEIKEYDNDPIEQGLEIVALETGQILEKLKTSPLLDKTSVETKTFNSKFYFNDMGKIKIENSKKKKSESLKYNTNFYKYMGNKPSQENTSNPKLTQLFFKPILNVNKPGPSSQDQKKRPETISTNKRFRNKIDNKNGSTLKRLCISSNDKTERLNSQRICHKSKSVVPQPANKVKKKVANIFYKNGDPLLTIKDQVNRAIREKKTFTVCGNFYSIRRALLSRGWVEKMRILYNTFDKENLKQLQTCTIAELIPGLKDPQKSFVYRRMIMTKLMGSHQVDFYWDQNLDCFRMCPDRIKCTLMNRFKRGMINYTSKKGLCDAMKYAYWYQNPGVSLLRQPRTYYLSDIDECKEFIKDFNQTTAASLLRWVANSANRGRTFKVVSKAGKVPIRAYHFATAEILKILRKCNHEDIDCDIENAEEYQWNTFLEDFYKIVHTGNHFCGNDLEDVLEMQRTSADLLKKLEQHRPNLKMDGMMNVWIMKPTNGSRGQGIYLCRTLQYILKIIKMNTTRRYVIQKYIERPLLIHRTKFDIRQWFLISCASPLTLWIYKDSYIRFSSQLYSLQRLHESIHLTNNSIQHRYKNCHRHRSLPDCNMWDSGQFQKYLASIGFPTVYKQIIYPGMKACLTAAMLINKNSIDKRKNCFELYGCDFMLTEDFQPWLIEINSNPALFASTPVTARLCPQVLEDVIKVIIDYPKDPCASTGSFELLYQEKFEEYEPTSCQKLVLKGKKLPTDYFSYNPSEFSSTELSQTDIEYPDDIVEKIGCEMKKTLQSLLGIIEEERCKMISLKNCAAESIEIKESQIENEEVEKSTFLYESNKLKITQVETKTVFKNSSETLMRKEKLVLNTRSDYTIGMSIDSNNLQLTEEETNSCNAQKTDCNVEKSENIFTGLISSLLNFSRTYGIC